MYCDTCGAENRDGARFCSACGRPVADAASSDLTLTTPPPGSQVPDPIVRALTTISIVEGFGAVIRDVRVPDLGAVVVEPLGGTALAGRLPSRATASRASEFKAQHRR